jgi:class 3 adenylate cyclase
MLLQVGFGEAGMGIIASNMGSGGSFDPVVEGTKVFAIFGFCDIRNFTDCCEVLEEETMIFTNQIARIVHNHVHKSQGSVNKNIGDAFLTVWKLNIPEEDEERFSGLPPPPGEQKVDNPHTAENSLRADQALRAFVLTRHLLETDAYVQALGSDPRLQRKLPGYTVRMGYGLHFGWAIEGAVGSKFKVDATYLSPHVNMSARLESSSKQYGVQMLLSGPFYDALGQNMRKECRPLDCVTVKGSNVPVMLYTHQVSEFARKPVSKEGLQEFNSVWAEAFALYKSGSDWPKAQELMRRCLEISPEDPPTLLLLRVMKDGPAPPSWDGYRSLTEK